MAEQFAKDGLQRGWSASVIVAPSGSAMKYDAVTGDIYPSWDAVFSLGTKSAQVFQQVHPDMDGTDVTEKAGKLRTLVSRQIFVVDRLLTPSK